MVPSTSAVYLTRMPRVRTVAGVSVVSAVCAPLRPLSTCWVMTLAQPARASTVHRPMRIEFPDREAVTLFLERSTRKIFSHQAFEHADDLRGRRHRIDLLAEPPCGLAKAR